MPIKLNAHEQEFRNELITQLDAKVIDLDRMLVNLFMWIKYPGQKPKSLYGRKPATVESLYQRLVMDETAQAGLQAYPEIVKKWLITDLIDMVYRGDPTREAVASPRPFQLDAYKLRNATHTRDYFASDQVYSLLHYGDHRQIMRLRDFFGAETQASLETPNTLEDLDTRVVKLLVSGADLADSPGGDERERAIPPLSIPAARLLADDVSRLLAYAGIMPRHVMLSYLRTILGFHLGLYVLRLWHLLPAMVQARQLGGSCPHCNGDQKDNPLVPCLYRPLLLVDMGTDFRSPMARLSQANAAAHFAQIDDYIKSVFTFNQLLRYVNDDYQRQQGPASIADGLGALSNRPPNFDVMFEIRLRNLFRDLKELKEAQSSIEISSRKQAREQSQWAEIDAIRGMNLSAFETLIEVITYVRSPFHMGFQVKLVDSLLQKNADTGLLRQGRARANGRRFHISSRLLEVLVQLAVLRPMDAGHQDQFRQQPILVHEFVEVLLNRYGLVVNGLDVVDWSRRGGLPVPDWASRYGVTEIDAFRNNLRALKDRLREIGFYTDLSDAYNAQAIRPLYSLETAA